MTTKSSQFVADYKRFEREIGDALTEGRYEDAWALTSMVEEDYDDRNELFHRISAKVSSR
jgi:hypothetical protein